MFHYKVEQELGYLGVEFDQRIKRVFIQTEVCDLKLDL